MNFNATLIGQMITFAVFVWFCLKYVWPPLMHALEERKAKIADGLAAAERGQKDLELAQARVTDNLKEAKQQAQEIINQAHKRCARKCLRLRWPVPNRFSSAKWMRKRTARCWMT